MRLQSPFFTLPALRSLLLFVMIVSLIGCGNSSQTPNSSALLPADAAYNNSVRSTGYLITDLGPGKAINNSGQVLGSESYAYLWTNGRRHYLGVLANDMERSRQFRQLAKAANRWNWLP